MIDKRVLADHMERNLRAVREHISSLASLVTKAHKPAAKIVHHAIEGHLTELRAQLQILAREEQEKPA